MLTMMLMRRVLPSPASTACAHPSEASWKEELPCSLFSEAPRTSSYFASSLHHGAMSVLAVHHAAGTCLRPGLHIACMGLPARDLLLWGKVLA